MIKRIITNFSSFVNEEKMRIYKLHKILQSYKDINLLKISTPLKVRKNLNTSLLHHSRDISYPENDPRLLFQDVRRSFVATAEFNQLHTISGEKYLKNQEKIDESALESYKDIQNSFYNDFSEDRIEEPLKNPLQILRDGQVSQYSEEKNKGNLEKIKEMSMTKYVSYYLKINF